MTMRARWTSAATLALVALALLPLALRAPRLTLLNAAVRVDFSWAVAAAALASGVLLATAAAVAPRRSACAGLAVVAALTGVFGAARLRYRLEVRPDGLYSRDLTGSTGLPWADVTRVDRGTEALVVWGRDDAQIRVDTGRFAGDQRAALERALARRIVESTQASKPPRIADEKP
jgi:hypothetical protein